MHGGLHAPPQNAPSVGPQATASNQPPAMTRLYSDGATSGYYVDGSNHQYKEHFEVPKKYLGLLIGKQGEAIKRFRAYAYDKGMAIVVNQNTSEVWVWCG